MGIIQQLSIFLLTYFKFHISLSWYSGQVLSFFQRLISFCPRWQGVGAIQHESAIVGDGVGSSALGPASNTRKYKERNMVHKHLEMQNTESEKYDILLGAKWAVRRWYEWSWVSEKPFLKFQNICLNWIFWIELELALRIPGGLGSWREVRWNQSLGIPNHHQHLQIASISHFTIFPHFFVKYGKEHFRKQHLVTFTFSYIFSGLYIKTHNLPRLRLTICYFLVLKFLDSIRKVSSRNRLCSNKLVIKSCNNFSSHPAIQIWSSCKNGKNKEWARK